MITHEVFHRGGNIIPFLRRFCYYFEYFLKMVCHLVQVYRVLTGVSLQGLVVVGRHT